MAAEKDVRPDPTCDNHWSDYKGAVHEHFTANAARFPDRPCVVERVGPGLNREFSNRQIEHASNTLAHFLVDRGVQRGDVAVIYSQRSAETVVAVLGILKAGAAFAVLDPAYPPDRLMVHLDVAKPRAVIAMERTGDMSEAMREWMEDNLKLHALLTRFRIDDAATLRSDARDLEEGEYRARGSIPPDVLIGPDDAHSITFTSGTTGRPRGVQGRHFTVTYSHAWWQELMGLSEHDRFSMLSGVAHDTLSRDVFTPLLLGASIIIPSQEDFTDLAGWMAETGVTFMHGTPAIAQILLESGKGRKLENLRAIMLGGEQLYRRDCRALQELAPNARIINGYGSTETGRSSSFFAIPALSDDPGFMERKMYTEVIPAGVGMQDTQVLVIDQATRQLCEVEAVGEIYVRGPGLVERYLLDEKQEHPEKFIDNWFVDPKQWVEKEKQLPHSDQPWRQRYVGPRDRMFRTGDLGRYLPDGNAVCLGRCDDVVNIRGYCLELGEIDALMVQHPLTRAQCAVQDGDSQSLNLYYVPHLPLWREWYSEQEAKASRNERPRLRRRVSATEEMSTEQLMRIFEPLTNDIRELLAAKLPSHAVPAHYVPMMRLPLTPNSKVDRKALPAVPKMQRSTVRR